MYICTCIFVHIHIYTCKYVYTFIYRCMNISTGQLPGDAAQRAAPQAKQTTPQDEIKTTGCHCNQARIIQSMH